MNLNSREEVRDFLRLCLDPGPGHTKRSVEQLAVIMPDWLEEPIKKHAPELAAMREAVEKAEAAATEARAQFTEGLRAWIEQEITAAEVKPVFQAPGDDHAHWSWSCPKEIGGCGYQSPWFMRTEKDAQDAYEGHVSRCRSAQVEAAKETTS